MWKFNYRYARPDAPRPLLFLDKIIRAKHGYRKTCLAIAGYYLLKSINNQVDYFWLAFDLAITVPPVVLWLFEIRKHGLLRGSRQWIHVLAEIFDKRLSIYSKRFWNFIFRLIGNSFAGQWYKNLPKIVKTFFLLFWYGTLSYLIFWILNNGGPAKEDTVCANILKNLFPSFDYGSYSPSAIVYSGGVVAMGLLHFTFSLGNQILNKINRKISISLIYQGSL